LIGRNQLRKERSASNCSVIEETKEEEEEEEEYGYRVGLTNMVTIQFCLWLRNGYRFLVGTT